MPSILWVEGSPKRDRSLSSQCAQAFLDALDNEIEVTHLDVWSDDIVSFGREAALAKFGPLFGEPHTPEQAAICPEAFSSGQDLIAAAYGDMGTAPNRGGFGIMAKPPTKPIIAAVEGHALAGGLELCLACDLIVSSRTATMGIPEAARSLVAIGGGLFRLPKRIPYHLAMELALTGKAWSAERMAELGLVNKLTEPGGALEGAIELANEILLAGPLAVQASKQIVQVSWGQATIPQRRQECSV